MSSTREALSLSTPSADHDSQSQSQPSRYGLRRGNTDILLTGMSCHSGASVQASGPYGLSTQDELAGLVDASGQHTHNTLNTQTGLSMFASSQGTTPPGTMGLSASSAAIHAHGRASGGGGGGSNQLQVGCGAGTL